MILILGGTGSLGLPLAKRCAKDSPVVIFSRNEHWQWMARQELPEARFVIGDVRDKDALHKVMKNCNIVFNCTAIKSIDIADDNPEETIKTNILGAMNIVDCAKSLGILNVVQISTDKAVNPSGIYGATKLVAEHLFTLNKFNVARLPNLYGSTSSVVELWAKQHAGGKPLTVTSKECYRYFTNIDKAVSFVLGVAISHPFGRVHVMPCEEQNIYELCRELYPADEIEIIGLRKGEKLREVMA